MEEKVVVSSKKVTLTRMPMTGGCDFEGVYIKVPDDCINIYTIDLEKMTQDGIMFYVSYKDHPMYDRTSYYRENPDKFYEELLGIKLSRWQKFLLSFKIR